MFWDCLLAYYRGDFRVEFFFVFFSEVFYEILDQFNYLFFNYNHKIDSSIFFEVLETITKHLPQNICRLKNSNKNVSK